MQINSKWMERRCGSPFLEEGLTMRIVSLVPSLTLTLFDLGCTSEQIVGRTPWCIHPADSVQNVPVVGGTKTPNLNKIMNAKPELVVMDREENPKEVYEELKSKGIEVFVSSVEHPSEVPEMLRTLGEKVGKSARAEAMAASLEATMNDLQRQPLPSRRVAPMIWHEPLMSVGPEKYAGGVLTSLGLTVPSLVEGGNGYPVVTPEALMEKQIEGLLLSSEPHDFAIEEGEAIAKQVAELGGQAPWSVCIDGEALTWFGSHTLKGLESLRKQIENSGFL